MNKLKEQIINFDWSLKSIMKASIAFVIVVVALSIAVGAFNFLTKGDNFTKQVFQMDGFAGGMEKMVSSFMVEPAFDQAGADAEEYERRNYNARYETRKFEQTCTAVSDLKPLEHVVFSSSNKSEDWCSYNFQAEVEYEEEIIAALKDLNPRDFSINTSTLERSIEYNDSELEMLQRRLTSTNETLRQAESSFNSLIAQATREGDTSTLSEVINNKISTVDRLNQQLLNTQDRIDRLTKNRGDQIEQIEYAHFNVSVQRVVFIDTDIWNDGVQELFTKFNATVLALSVGLITFALGGIQMIVLGAIALVGITIFAKVMWVVVRRIWRY